MFPQATIEESLVFRLALSWNNLDTAYIEPVLDIDIIYESQWVLIPIRGKSNLINHFRTKFDTIKTSAKSSLMVVNAEIAYHPDKENRPCLFLSQTSESGIVVAVQFITTKEDLIRRIDICFIPDPSKAILTGVIPK